LLETSQASGNTSIQRCENSLLERQDGLSGAKKSPAQKIVGPVASQTEPEGSVGIKKKKERAKALSF